MTYGFPPSEGGEGGGATAFTELTDAPGLLTPNSILTGNDDGTALKFSPRVTIVDPGTLEGFTSQCQILVSTVSDGDNSQVVAASYSPGFADPSVLVQIQSDLSEGVTSGGLQITRYDAEGNDSYFRLGAFDGQWLMSRQDGPDFAMYGFDTPATDTTARLTVDGTSYGIAKAIQVKIGADTHYWPLFGGEDAGPAPAPSIVETIVPNGVVIGNGAGDALVMVPGDGQSVLIAAGNGATDGGGISLESGEGSAGEGGSIGLTAADGTVVGGSVNLQAGDLIGDAGHLGSQLLLGGSGSFGQGGDVSLIAGMSNTVAGGDMDIEAGSGTTGGDLLLFVGGGTADADRGKLILGNAGGALADPNNAQAVTYDTAIGPGGAAISIKRWIPITIDGNAGWIPHFGV